MSSRVPSKTASFSLRLSRPDRNLQSRFLDSAQQVEPPPIRRDVPGSGDRLPTRRPVSPSRLLLRPSYRREGGSWTIPHAKPAPDRDRTRPPVNKQIVLIWCVYWRRNFTHTRAVVSGQSARSVPHLGRGQTGGQGNFDGVILFGGFNCRAHFEYLVVLVLVKMRDWVCSAVDCRHRWNYLRTGRNRRIATNRYVQDLCS